MCPRDIDAAALLRTATPHPENPRQRFNILNGAAYRALPTDMKNSDGDDMWHGHPFPLEQVPNLGSEAVDRGRAAPAPQAEGMRLTSVTWRAQTGSTGRFALDIALVEDPDDVGFLDDAEKASWGSLSIWAAGVNLCNLNGTGAPDEGAHWYLLGLTEWFVENWVPLFHEQSLPGVNSSTNAADGAFRSAKAAELIALVDDDYGPAQNWQEWKYRHSLRSAEPEALFPDLYFRRYGDSFELSLGSARLPGLDTGVAFPRIATVRVPVTYAARVVHSSLTKLIDELLLAAPGSPRLQEAKKKLDDLASPGTAGVAALAWLSGAGDHLAEFEALLHRSRDALSTTEQGEALELPAHSRSPEAPSIVLSTPFSLLYGSLSPDISSDDVIGAYRVILTAPRNELARGRLVEMNRFLTEEFPPGTPETAGERGSSLGDAFYFSYVEGDAVDGPAIDIAAILDGIGVWVEDAEINDDSVRGVSILGSDGTTGIIVNTKYRGGRSSAIRRFTLAHELGHLVLDQEYSRELVVASGPWAPVEVEQRANAFAASLLMPSTVVGRTRGALTGDLDSADVIRRLSRLLDVSYSALVSRLQNLGLISFEHAEDLRKGPD